MTPDADDEGRDGHALPVARRDFLRPVKRVIYLMLENRSRDALAALSGLASGDLGHAAIVHPSEGEIGSTL